MEFYNLASAKTCKRARYYTGNEKIIGTANAFTLEDMTGTGKQMIGGRAYLSSFYAYVLSYVPSGVASDIWIMLFDVSGATANGSLPAPRLVWRVPVANQPDTVFYEPAESECDEITFEDGVTQKVGAFFENGVRIFASSSGTALVPVASWGYVTKADFVMMSQSRGGVV